MDIIIDKIEYIPSNNFGKGFHYLNFCLLTYVFFSDFLLLVVHVFYAIFVMHFNLFVIGINEENRITEYKKIKCIRELASESPAVMEK